MCVVRKVAVDTTSLFGMHSSNGQWSSVKRRNIKIKSCVNTLGIVCTRTFNFAFYTFQGIQYFEKRCVFFADRLVITREANSYNRKVLFSRSITKKRKLVVHFKHFIESQLKTIQQTKDYKLYMFPQWTNGKTSFRIFASSSQNLNFQPVDNQETKIMTSLKCRFSGVTKVVSSK